RLWAPHPGRAEVPVARRLRRDETDVERLLWAKLRNRGVAGHKFRRQQPIAGFVADFACLEAKLVIELDGGQHGGVADRVRTAVLQREGFALLRFWNNEVLENLDGVLVRIAEALPPHPPAADAAGPSLSPEGRGIKALSPRGRGLGEGADT